LPLRSKKINLKTYAVLLVIVCTDLNCTVWLEYSTTAGEQNMVTAVLN